MGAYITAADVIARYATLKTWYKDHGHFWVGTGPYYLDTANPIAKTLVLKNFGHYPDLADRWSSFSYINCRIYLPLVKRQRVRLDSIIFR
jgi:peptide/nickel transport system substrate-binding protein